MGNVHLVTGYAGQEHVTAADVAAFNSALLGIGQFVLGKGNKLSASVVTNNQIRVLDGDIYMQGRHIRLNEGTYVDLTIENGTQGQLRNDLIVARYTKDSVTGVEDCNLVVIKGTPAESDPSDPAYTSGDLIAEHAMLNDMPIYRVPLNGLNVGELVPMFKTFEETLPEIIKLLANKAPAGYGIGEEDAALVKDADLDTLKNGGTYFIGTGCTNTPPNTDTAWSTLYVIPGRACTQIFIPANDANRAGTFSSWIARIYNNETAAWGAWEWVNPPMQLGVEYRTTERYLGKPVYVKVIDFGTLSNNNFKVVSANIGNKNDASIVDYKGYAVTGNYVEPFPIIWSGPVIKAYAYVEVYNSYWSIRVTTSADLSSYSAKFVIKYTKTTD